MLRKIERKDAALYLTFAREFFSSEAVLHPVPESYFMRTFEEICSDSPYADGYMIEDGGEPVGYVQLSLTYSNEVGGIAVWVEELYVRAPYRGKGLGGAALDQLKELYPEAGRFRLEVVPDNADAQKLYASKGFEVLPYTQMVCDRER